MFDLEKKEREQREEEIVQILKAIHQKIAEGLANSKKERYSSSSALPHPNISPSTVIAQILGFLPVRARTQMLVSSNVHAFVCICAHNTVRARTVKHVRVFQYPSFSNV